MPAAFRPVLPFGEILKTHWAVWLREGRQVRAQFDACGDLALLHGLEVLRERVAVPLVVHEQLVGVVARDAHDVGDRGDLALHLTLDVAVV